jgi:hypothetical protein
LHDTAPLSELEIKALQESLKENENARKVLDIALQGRTLEEMGQAIGKTRELARHIIEGLGIYTTWHYLKKKEYLTPLVSLLKTRISQLLNDPSLSWAERKAYEYNLQSRSGLTEKAIPHEKLVKLFTLYEQAKFQGRKPSLKELAQLSSLKHKGEPRRIFSRSNIPPLYRKLEFKHISKEKARAIKNTAKLGYLNMYDILRFSQLSPPTILRYTKNLIKRKRMFIEDVYLERDGALVCMGYLTYSIASQIYEAHDAGLSSEETSQLLEKHEEVVSYARSHREKIAPEIVKALRTLFPRAHITTPYYTPSFEEKYK